MLRWRTDKPVEQADTMATLEALLDGAARSAPVEAVPTIDEPDVDAPHPVEPA